MAALVLLLLLLPVVSGCGLTIVSLDAPTNVDVMSAYNVTMTVAIDGSHSAARGVLGGLHTGGELGRR